MVFPNILELNGFPIGGDKTYIIAEMACAHNGSFEDAKKLIDAAADAKANAVQFQFFEPEALVTMDHSDLDLYKRIQFTKEQWRSLNDYARAKGLDTLTTAYDYPALELAIELELDGVKLNSSDLSNFEMLDLLAKEKIFFTLGAGASTVEEIQEAIDRLTEGGTTNFVLMHGLQSFPTHLDTANIKRVEFLRNSFGIITGYADHTPGGMELGKYIDLLALGMGAKVLEKHITLDRTQKGLDYHSALEPRELKEYVQHIRNAELALGDYSLGGFSQSEIGYRQFQKKQIVAAKELKEGDVLSRENVAFLRTEEGFGLSPMKFPSLENTKIAKAIGKHKLITPDALKK